MKSPTLAVVFAYFSTGDDAQAANQVKMAQILEFTHSIRAPFVIAADLNMEPDLLWETDWLKFVVNAYPHLLRAWVSDLSTIWLQVREVQSDLTGVLRI